MPQMIPRLQLLYSYRLGFARTLTSRPRWPNPIWLSVGGAHADTCGVARDAGCSSQSPNSRRTLRSTACRVTPDGLTVNCYASPVGRGCAINLGSFQTIT